MVENRQPDPEQLQIENERKARQQFDLLGVRGRAAGGECIGDEMLDQERADRNDAAERMKLAKQERMSLTGAQRRDAFMGA